MGSVPGAGEATDFTDYTEWGRCQSAKFNAENGVEKERDAEDVTPYQTPPRLSQSV